MGHPPATAAKTNGDRVAITMVAIQLAIVVFLAYYFRIEGHVFAEKVMPLAALGFLPHHLAPARYRLGIFVALSLATIVFVLGVPGLWVIGIVGVMLLVCHLPIPFGARAGLIVILGASMGAMRAGVLTSPLPGAIWPVIGSILMFRLAVYLYDLRHQKTPPGLGFSLAYFFLLPNVAFPLFPVVDFATFKRTYYDRPPIDIYRVGVRWMLRGILHLVVYRVVYQYVVISSDDVVSSVTLVRYLLANYLLYLRVSGAFHLVVGVLHLYGFRLPETHHLFYLATSFTELWRRINTYWKDFMQKMVFAPLFYPLRRRVGDMNALTLATIATIAGTWALHAYQTFWILGRWPLSGMDMLFWTLLGALLVANTQIEARRGRTRSLVKDAARATTVSAGLLLALRTAVFFSAMCVLWTLWTSPSLSDFLSLFAVVRPRVQDLMALLAVPVAIGVIAIAFDRGVPLYEQGPGARPQLAFALALSPLAVLAVFTYPSVAGQFGIRAHRLAFNIRSSSLNRRDAANLQRGYYGKLMGVNGNQGPFIVLGGDLWRLYADIPADWSDVNQAGIDDSIPGFLATGMHPSRTRYFHGATFSTNSFGMRDREYTLAKPPGTWRIALLGRSDAMGDGVGNDSTYEAQLEHRLNDTRPAGAPKVEILNFARSAYTPLQEAFLLDSGGVREFSPDVVLYIGNEADLTGANHLWHPIRRNQEIPYPAMREIARKANLRKDLTPAQVRRALRPYEKEVTQWTYHHIVETSHAIGALPAWVSVPIPLQPDEGSERTLPLAREAGFIVLDVPHMYIGHDENALTIAPWDRHPNFAGHRIIANRLFDALALHPELVGRAPAAKTP